ncbi:hypothetical protein DEU56DRAFT_828090 [Suillus clintonianus]|uniref:uncharacterized protein n=1 Tax=Suillus clintonianus TaxID=1904413 RepID=UPI001B862E72|nr:uncharacterized protein DEU56DRAFT_828090 [Suillus clintonianus]KAG2124189.1 hypothetical protein DEU56DRAFT_828090 [Suillus clintonianus]
MATDSKVLDDSSSTATAPPSYDTISASPIQYNQSSIFSSRRMKQKRAAVLSRIRDIVLAPDYTPSSVVPNLNACADVLPAAELFDILQKLNIEGHTALYWAIVNNRLEAFWAFLKFIPTYAPVGQSEVRIACMMTNDHALFTKLDLGKYIEISRLRCSLGCPPDKIQVHACDEPLNQFNVVLRIGMFQKRLRTQCLCFQFVAGGRICWLRFRMQQPTSEMWHAEIGLSRYSPSARLNAVLVIEAHSRKPGCATPPEALKIPLSLTDTKFVALASWLSPEGISREAPPKMTCCISNELGDWVMHA